MSEVRTVDSGQAFDWDTEEDISDSSVREFQFKDNNDNIVTPNVAAVLQPDNQTVRWILTAGFFTAGGAGAGAWHFRPIITRPSGVFSSDYERLEVGE